MRLVLVVQKHINCNPGTVAFKKSFLFFFPHRQWPKLVVPYGTYKKDAARFWAATQGLTLPEEPLLEGIGDDPNVLVYLLPEKWTHSDYPATSWALAESTVMYWPTPEKDFLATLLGELGGLRRAGILS